MEESGGANKRIEEDREEQGRDEEERRGKRNI